MASTIPDDLLDLVTTNGLGHVSAIRKDGSMAHYLMWIDYDGEHLLTSSMVGSLKAAPWRSSMDPATPSSVVDRSTSDWRYVVARGRVVEVRPDEGLAFIDKMSMRYIRPAVPIPGAAARDLRHRLDHVAREARSRLTTDSAGSDRTSADGGDAALSARRR